MSHTPSQFFSLLALLSFFFFNDPATTEIYTLSLHDALPICSPRCGGLHGRADDLELNGPHVRDGPSDPPDVAVGVVEDRKSTRLNSSHTVISYAVFCLKKKKKTKTHNNAKASMTQGVKMRQR